MPSKLTDLNPSEIEKRELKEAIAWLRPDPRQRLYPAWGLGVLLLIVGSTCCGIFFHQAMPDSALLLMVGLGSVLCGMLTMVISALKVLSDETCLLWTQQALIYRDQNARRSEWPWSDIEKIYYPESQEYIELTHINGEYLKVHVRSMRLDPQLLCRVLKEEQRRALMGLELRDAYALRALKLPVSIASNINKASS